MKIPEIRQGRVYEKRMVAYKKLRYKMEEEKTMIRF